MLARKCSSLGYFLSFYQFHLLPSLAHFLATGFRRLIFFFFVIQHHHPPFWPHTPMTIINTGEKANRNSLNENYCCFFYLWVITILEYYYQFYLLNDFITFFVNSVSGVIKCKTYTNTTVCMRIPEFNSVQFSSFEKGQSKKCCVKCRLYATCSLVNTNFLSYLQILYF